MREQFKNLKIPDKYKTGIIKYEVAIDGYPEMLDLLKWGFNHDEIKKIEKLIQIESLRHSYVDAKEYEPESLTIESIRKYNENLNELIEEYNLI